MLLSAHVIEGSAFGADSRTSAATTTNGVSRAVSVSCGTAPPAFSVLASRETATTTVPTRLFHTTP